MGNASSDQAKESFLQICASKGSGNVDEVKRILTQYPALLNEDSNRFGVTVLMHASSWNHVEVVEYLLTLPALKVNQQSTRIYGRTALHFASSYGHIKIVRLLLSHPQIDTSIKTWFGKTASEICCEEFGAIHSNKPFLEDLFKNHARGKTTVVPPPRPPRLSNKITVNPPLPDKHVHSPSTDEAKATDAQIDNKELKHEIKIEEVQIFQRLKFPLFLQLSLIHLKLLILKDELQFAIDTKAFQKAKEITAENKLWSQWRENLLLSLEDLPSFSQDLNVVKFDVLEQLESHFRNCLEKDESEDLLAGIDSFRTELINVIEESIFNQRQNMPLRLSEHVTTSPISHLDPSIFTYPLPPNKLTHVFLTHTWRRDEEGRDNHMRVARINDALKKRGIITWFDSDRMTGTIRSTMTKALYSTCCVLIFITREYEKKVNLDDESDNCYFEFKVVSEDHQLVNMRIPVVMDKSMTNPNEWSRGILKAELGGKLFFDMSSDNEEEIETRCDEIVGRMMELLKGKYPTYY